MPVCDALCPYHVLLYRERLLSALATKIRPNRLQTLLPISTCAANQWYLEYGEEEWRHKSEKCLAQMNTYHEAGCTLFPRTLVRSVSCSPVPSFEICATLLR
jgi:hypothetical protein